MRPDTAVTTSWSCHLQWWRASAEGTDSGMLPRWECHTYIPKRGLSAQAASHLGFPCIGAPPVTCLCFGARSLGRPFSGRHSLVLRGRAETQSHVAWPGQAEGRKEAKGTCRGLGNETHRGSFDRLHSEAQPGIELLGNREPLHCLYISLSPWSRAAREEVTRLGS